MDSKERGMRKPHYLHKRKLRGEARSLSDFGRGFYGRKMPNSSFSLSEGMDDRR
jgi:hypothetical protein